MVSDNFLDAVDADLRREFLIAQESLSITLGVAKEVADAAFAEFEAAISLRGKGVPFNHDQNSVPAIDAWSSACPTGQETGNFYVIDLGGSNLRAVAVRLEGRGDTSVTEKKVNLRQPRPGKPKGLLDAHCTASELFDEIAINLRQLISQVGDNPAGDNAVAFTFSFPCVQRGIASADLLMWTKEFETGMATNDPVVGQDVGALLNSAFVRNGMPHTSVACLINDTVGTMLSAGYTCNYSHQAARVGVILGTGFNIAYMDKAAPEQNYGGSIVNLECGNFNKLRSIRTLIDEEVDFYSSCRGGQWTEKMVSGLYLGEICRLWLIRVFRFECPEAIFVRNSFATFEAASIFNDRSKKYSASKEVLQRCFNWEINDPAKLRIVYKLICLVFDRSATIAGILTYVCALRTKFVQRALGGTTVGVDGSVYLLNPKYQKSFQKTIQKLLGSKADLVRFVPASDGSGLGGAVMAAVECEK